MNLTTISQAILTMTSREIAALVDSTHDSVLKTIRRLISEGVVFGNETPYTHEQNGQTYSEFLLSFRNTMVVASGYSAELRAKIIDRWQELENKNLPSIPKTMAQALRLAADQAEQIEAQQLQLEQQKPAVEFVDRFVEAKSAKGFREVAKILGLKEREFIAELAADKVIFKQGSNWLPMAEHQHTGRFTVKTGEANGHAFIQTRFTPEGIAWVAKRYSKAA